MKSSYCRKNSLVSALSLVLALVLLLPGCAARRDDPGPQTPADAEVGEAGTDAVDSAGVRADEGKASDEAAPGDGDLDSGALDLQQEALEMRVSDHDAFDDAGDEDLEDTDSVEDPAVLVAEALEACELASRYWEQGNIEAALATLDHAYALLLEIPTDDPEFDQSRQDLRHLVSRRVVEIYRSRLTSAVDLGSAIPVDINPHVEREIRNFQGPERSFFLESYRRSGQYRPMIVRMLRDAGMPEELSWLPLVESGFKTRALSRARAMGMWQFISSTGYRFGLSRSHWIDERMDPEKSTRAAIEYLTELHGMFGDWMTALAGYNCGEHRVMSVIRRQPDQYLDHFWDLFEQLPRETARYVPRFLATLSIIRDPEKYGFELPDPLPPVGFETVPIERHMLLGDLERALELSKGTLAALNPELRRGVTPGEAYELKVPAAAAPAFQAKLAQLPAYVPPEDTYVVHRVRRGETLSTIARRYGSSVNSIVAANNLRSRHRIQIGQRLKIPTRGAPVRASVSIAPGGEAATMTYRVRRGDSLWRLASRYGTTVDRIKRDNGLRSDRLTIGQTLRINTGVPSGSDTYTVRRGDTVGKIAQAHRVSLSAVLLANGLSRSSTIYPGQVLIIPN